MVKLDFIHNAKFWRDIIYGWDTKPFYSNPDNYAKLEKWCRTATDTNDVYEFLETLRSKPVFEYYNTNISRIENYEYDIDPFAEKLKYSSPRGTNFNVLKDKCDEIVNQMPDGLSDTEKAAFIWKHVRAVDYDFRGLSGSTGALADRGFHRFAGNSDIPTNVRSADDSRGFSQGSVPAAVTDDARFLRNNKTLGGTMSAIIKMVCMHRRINIPCEIVGTTGGHVLNAMNIDGDWTLTDWTFAKLKEQGNRTSTSGHSNAAMSDDFFLTSRTHYNEYEPECGHIDGFHVPTIKVPKDRVLNAMLKVADMKLKKPNPFFKLRQSPQIEF